jgi:hypothetical protein
MRNEVAWLQELGARRGEYGRKGLDGRHGKYGRYGADASGVAELSL